jgi:hypothetical protein
MTITQRCASIATKNSTRPLCSYSLRGVEVQHATQDPVKDEEKEHPVAITWRPTLRQIAKAIAEGDHDLSRGIPAVSPVSSTTANQIRAYVSQYPETLTELSDDTWNSSVAQWMGTHWEVTVDLWTIESGRSDLILSVFVFETDDGFRFEVDSVHVP